MKNKIIWANILTKEFLTEHHLELNKGPSEIARELGCDRLTVIRYLERLQLPFVLDKTRHGKKRDGHFAWKGHGEISMTFWRNIKNSGRTRGIPVEITIEDAWNLFLKQNRKCALTGIEIGFFACNNNSASLDRIDSTKGYLLDNIQWVHKDVNYAKQSLNNLAFIELCRKVVQQADNPT